jgi:hypothetical protein
MVQAPRSFITTAIVPFVTTLSTDLKTGIGGGGEGANYPRPEPDRL